MWKKKKNADILKGRERERESERGNDNFAVLLCRLFFIYAHRSAQPEGKKKTHFFEINSELSSGPKKKKNAPRGKVEYRIVFFNTSPKKYAQKKQK